MADEEINYTKEVLASTPNMTFIGLMLFMMLAINFGGFLALVPAGEMGALFVAHDPRVQRIIRARKNKDRRIEVEEAETVIVNSLPGNYQSDYYSLRRLCDEIERRSNELGDASASGLLLGVVGKLMGLRFDFARSLMAAHLSSESNYNY